MYAKEAVAIQKLSLPKIDNKNWQLWFAKVNARLGATQPEKEKQDPPASENTKTKKSPLPHGICTFHPTDDFKSPKWNWSPVVEQFTWSPQCEDIPFPHTSVSISPSNWDKVFAWIKQQKWRNTEGVGTSWIEMAAKAYFDGLRLDKLNTPKSYVHAIQKVVNQTAKLDSSIELVPHPSIKRCKTNGKSHPMRMIPNFEMLVTPEALKFVATSMLRGHHNSASIKFCDIAFPNV